MEILKVLVKQAARDKKAGRRPASFVLEMVALDR